MDLRSRLRFLLSALPRPGISRVQGWLFLLRGALFLSSHLSPSCHVQFLDVMLTFSASNTAEERQVEREVPTLPKLRQRLRQLVDD
jgi:hypothetical protein